MYLALAVALATWYNGFIKSKENACHGENIQSEIENIICDADPSEIF